MQYQPDLLQSGFFMQEKAARIAPGGFEIDDLR